MEFDKYKKEALEGEGLTGKVELNESEESYQLNVGMFDIGLCEPFWQEFEGKWINIKIEILE